MRIAYTPEQERLRQELRAYFAGLMTPEVRAALSGGDEGLGDGEAYRQVVRQLGRDGWLALGWPAEYGGRGGDDARPAHLHRRGGDRPGAGAVPDHQHGRADDHAVRDARSRRRSSCPGSSRASSTSRSGTPSRRPAPTWPRCAPAAVRDGDEYVINGQKMWTSLIQYADYVWLACRTDPDAPAAQGAVDPHRADADRRASPGRRCTRSPGATTSATYYDDVRVPASSLVGEENGGWPLITNQLNHERVALTSAAPVQSALRRRARLGRATRLADGQRVIDPEWVQLNLARVHAKAEFLKLLNWQIASAAGGRLGPADASATKVFGTEFAIEAYRLLMEVLGAGRRVRVGLARRGAGRPDRAGAPLRAHPDVRRRHQRGAARHHRGRRPRAARCRRVSGFHAERKPARTSGFSRRRRSRPA